MKKLWKIFAVLTLSFVMCLSLASAETASTRATVVETETETTENGVKVSKVATDTDTEDLFNIDLSIQGEQEVKNVAVMFILDKSTSVEVKEAAEAMLNDVESHTTNVNLYADVIVFNQNSWSTGFQKGVTQEITDALAYKVSSGSNIDGGIIQAKKDLEKLTTTYGNMDETYVVLISDGITYMWGDANASKDGNPNTWKGGDGEDYYDVSPMALYICNSSNPTSKSLNHTNSYASQLKYSVYMGQAWDNGNGNTYANACSNKDLLTIYGVEKFSNIIDVMDNNNAADISLEYATLYSTTQEDAFNDSKYINFNTVITNKDREKVINSQYLTNTELAIYMTYKSFKNGLLEALKDTESYGKTTTYAFALDSNGSWKNAAEPNFYGQQLMQGLADLTSSSLDDEPMTDGNYQDYFDSIYNKIIYTIESGEVTDVIGSAFDFVANDELTVTVDDTEYVLSAMEQEDGSIVYTSEDAPYSVTYVKDEDGKEALTWAINTPVVQGTVVKLSYQVKLVEKETADGKYTVPTNKSAILTYKSTEDSETKTITFKQPQVSYQVSNVKVEDPQEENNDPATPEGPEKDNGVKTGDTSSYTLYIAMLGTSISLIGLIYLKKRIELKR